MLMSLLCVWEDLMERLQQDNVIVGIALCILGISLACLARRIACFCRKTDSVSNEDGIMLTIKVIGLVLIVVAAIVLIIKQPS